MGEPQISCGDNRSYYVACPSGQADHDLRHIVQGCKTILCRVCYVEAINREAGKAAERLRGIHGAYRTIHGIDLGWPYHFSFSPPPDLYHLGEAKLRQMAIDQAKGLGIIGGCIVSHELRAKGSTQREKDQLYDAFRRGEIELPFSLHFHLLGFAPGWDSRIRLDPGIRSDAFNARTGWTYTCFGAQNPKRKHCEDRRRNLFKTIRYELGHCHVQPGKHCLTWWGICAYNNVTVEKITEQYADLCSVCSCQNHLYLDGQDQGEHLVKLVRRRYEIKQLQLDRMLLRHGHIIGPRLPLDQDLARLCEPGPVTVPQIWR